MREAGKGSPCISVSRSRPNANLTERLHRSMRGRGSAVGTNRRRKNRMLQSKHAKPTHLHDKNKLPQNKAFSRFPLHHLCFILVLTVPPATLHLLHNLTNCTPERETLYISSGMFRLSSNSLCAEGNTLQML